MLGLFRLYDGLLMQNCNMKSFAFLLLGIHSRGVRFYRFSGFYQFALFTVRKTGSF